MPEEPNAFLIGGVLLRTLEEVNYSCYLHLNCRKLKINEELCVVSSEIRRIAPEHFHSPSFQLRGCGSPFIWSGGSWKQNSCLEL